MKPTFLTRKVNPTWKLILEILFEANLYHVWQEIITLEQCDSFVRILKEKKFKIFSTESIFMTSNTLKARAIRYFLQSSMNSIHKNFFTKPTSWNRMQEFPMEPISFKLHLKALAIDRINCVSRKILKARAEAKPVDLDKKQYSLFAIALGYTQASVSTVTDTYKFLAYPYNRC